MWTPAHKPQHTAPYIIGRIGRVCLLSQAPAHKFKHTARTIESALGMSVVELFEYIDARPVASGSIGQIHRARLSPRGAALTGEHISLHVRGVCECVDEQVYVCVREQVYLVRMCPCVCVCAVCVRGEHVSVHVRV